MTNTDPMHPSRSRRRTPLRITAVGAVALTGVLFAGCGSGKSGAVKSADATPITVVHDQMTGDHMDMSHGARTASESALYQAMQNLWQQHMEWTYGAIAAFAANAPGLPATVDRLLQNQVDIGNAVVPYYGAPAAKQLTTLLQAHINGVVAILTAAKANDSVAQGKAVTAEYANAKAIGDFLATANPSNWAKTDMEAMMKTHIDQTLVYATDLLKGDYAQGITEYGKAEAHMVQMGDMLSAGVIAQFPSKFRK
jgi:hypothetical protein